MVPLLFRSSQPLPRALALAGLLASWTGLSGCADMSESMTSAFADPAKYELYDCKQLETERRTLSKKLAELQGLISKAREGAAGPVVAEIAYRNDYIALRGQSKNADEAWQRNKCQETPAAVSAQPAVSANPAPNDKSGRPSIKSGNAVY